MPCRLSSWKFVVSRMSADDIDIANGCTVRSSRHGRAVHPPPLEHGEREPALRAAREAAAKARVVDRIGASATARSIGTSAALSWSKIASTSAVFIPGS